MSTDSALILFRDRLPSRADLEAQLDALGYRVELGAFDLEGSKGWIDMRVDGRRTGFDYGLFPLTQEDFGPFPKKALKAGDTALSFGARGKASIVAVSMIQHAMSLLAAAHGLIETSLIPPEEVQRGSVQSIAIFSAPGPAAPESEFSARMAEFREAIPRLLLIFAVAAAVILGFPRLLAWIGR